MNDLDALKVILQKVRKRIRIIYTMNGLAKGLFWGSLAAAIVIALYKVLPVPTEFLLLGVGTWAILIITGCIISLRRPLSILHAAHWLDEKQQLKERISAAVEMSADPAAKEWSSLLVADARNHVQNINLHQILPMHLPKICQWTLLVLILGAGLGFVPEHRSERYIQKKREIETIKEAGRNLANITRRKLVQSPPSLESTRQNIQNVSVLGDHLLKATLTRNEALKDIANVADKLKQETRQLAQNAAFKRMEKAARESSASSASTPSELQKKLDEMSQQMGRQSTNAAALEQLKKDLQQAKEAAQGLANSNQNEGNNNNKDQLEKTLSSLARKAQDLGVSVPSLDNAIDALASAQTELFVRELNAALNDLEKMREMSQAMQQLQQQIEAAAKNLAEQLEKGQARTAQETLNKMVEVLKSSNANPEQLKKILQEVTEAIKPAAEYGKVADLLKQAAGNMASKNNEGAAQKLDEAAKELERLLAEMGDLDSLQAMMESLEKASMSVGTGLNWGQCQGNMLGRGKGGKGGKGFGTWVDEEGWQQYPEYSELWENPEDDRGNMDARSRTDRGDGQLSENLDSTKIRGRMSPGGSMPSITLKGVSIKGQSSVAYQEAAVAAQSQAESALNQDLIPKAYRGAVKDYFDDMKNK